MKTLLYSIVMIISGSILLSSCNQGASFTLTKRHYAKGYYVDYTNKHEIEKPENIAVADKKESVVVPFMPLSPTTNNKVVIANSRKILNNNNANRSVSEVPKTNNKSLLSNVIKNASYKSVLSTITAAQILTKNKMQFENAPQNITATKDEGGHRAHSLFWTVILIILILWLIGILTGGFGIGVLINLLLLVALVLFILWLLWLI